MGLWERAGNALDQAGTLVDQLQAFRDDIVAGSPRADRGVVQPPPPGLPGLPDGIAVNPRVQQGVKIAALVLGAAAVLYVLRQ